MAENEDPVDDTSTNNVTNEPFLKGTYRGKPVTWDEENARTLAQKGLDYETKMSELAAQRQTVEQDGQAFGEWKEWRRALASDPRRSQAMQKAYDDPESVLAPKVTPDPDGDPPAEPQTPRSLPPEMLQMRADLEQLQRTINSQMGETRETQMTDRLGRAADSFDFLKDNKAARSLAVRQAAHFLTAEPDASPEGAMAAIVEELREATTATQQRKLETKIEGEQLRTVPASEGTPNPGPKPKEHDPNDLRFGKVRSKIMATLKQDYGDRFPGL